MPIFFFLKLIIFIACSLKNSQNFFMQSLPIYTSWLFSMLLNEDIIHIEKPDGVSWNNSEIANYLISWNFYRYSWKYDWTTWNVSEKSYFFRWEEKIKFILLIVTILLYCLAVYCSGPGSMVRGLSVLSK